MILDKKHLLKTVDFFIDRHTKAILDIVDRINDSEVSESDLKSYHSAMYAIDLYLKEKGKVVKMSTRKIMYLRSSKNDSPVGCIAFSLSKDRRTIRYQVSTLNPIDKFERSLARHIALGRLLENPFRIKNMYGDENMSSIFRTVMLSISNNKLMPNRARKAAMSWLNNKVTPDW